MASDGFTYLELQEAGYDLYDMLNSKVEEILIDACQCIKILYENTSNRELYEEEESTSTLLYSSCLPIDYRLVIDRLLEILNSKNTSDECILSAAYTLGEFSTSKILKNLITNTSNNNESIIILVNILRNNDRSDDCKEAITWILRNLCIENPRNMTEIALAGAIDPLVDQLLYGNDSYKIAAANALCNLACDNSNTAAITSAGAITPLVALLSHTDAR